MNKCFVKFPALVLTLVVGALAASSTMGQANIVIENFDQPNVGFNDTTAAAPIGGNNGTTVGQQRLNAFQHAAAIWGATLPSGPTITVRASWDPSLACGPTSGTLGSAGSITIHRNFAGAPFTDTWFGGALANTLAGVDLDPANPEIRARFNPDIGTAGECLQNSHWYYGLDTNDPNPFGSINLVTVLLHEFAHGLGFQTFTSSSTGTQNNGFPTVYDHFLFDNTTSKNWTQMTNAERMASAVNTGNLVWSGTQVLADGTLLSSGKDAQGHPRIYAPNPVQGGSSISHWDTVLSPNQLMEPSLSSSLSHSVSPPEDLTLSLLRDIGWCVSNCPPPPPPSPTPTPSPPANNDFANAQIIHGCLDSINGTNVGANKESGEPSHSPDNDPGGGSVWYQWQAPSSGSVTMTTAGSGYDTLLAVYTGNSVNALTAIAKNDDVNLGVDLTSSVTFTATAGTIYKIAVDGWDGSTGNISFNWSASTCPDNTINSVAPRAGRTSGGQQVKLFGPFANVSAVMVGGVSASWSYTNGTSEITVITPPHVVGAVAIEIVPSSGATTTRSNAFAYLPTVFTDDTLVLGVTTAKAQHIIELRQSVDALRAVAGLGPAAWTDNTLVQGTTTIKAVHIQELRTHLDSVATMLSYVTQPYTDPSLTSGYVIKRVHVEELRQRIRTIAG